MIWHGFFCLFWGIYFLKREVKALWQPGPQIRFDCVGNLLSRRLIAPVTGNNDFRLLLIGEPQSYQPSQQYTGNVKLTLTDFYYCYFELHPIILCGKLCQMWCCCCFEPDFCLRSERNCVIAPLWKSSRDSLKVFL